MAASNEDKDPPLGAHWDGSGTRFTIFSAHAATIELCLYESPASIREQRRVALERKGDGIFTTYLPGTGPGALYGYRVEGDFAPQEGHRFNRSKLLIDPYARALTGEPRADPSLFGFGIGRDPDYDFEGGDSAGAMPKAVVIDGAFDWQGIGKPKIPWSDTLVYEAHLKGLTQLHPEVPPEQRGKYLGLAAPPMIEHLKGLGVTTIELLPLCQFASETHLLFAGRRNYWGYSPLAFFAPHAAYASGGRGEQVVELKTMVRELHRHGLEVLVDMVFNHTVEGGAVGPTLSLKGIDNHSYYRLDRRHPRRYEDFTGCGNTLDIRQPAMRRLALDALRYWALELGVDGFRLDLASVLGRDGDSFTAQAAFFAAIAEDPQLAELKWIVEPWDVGPGGYQLGNFPPGFAEWNDRFRNTVRRFWRGDARGEVSGELASRLAGSRDLFAARAPLASLNYLCSHDGFTLADLVSYENKHNEANLEGNRDGTGENFSCNWGAEGPSKDPAIGEQRRRARVNLVATLMLSLGVPMLAHGDEIGRTQSGNNNPYCQDNTITWVDWSGADWEFCRQVKELIALRRRHALLRSTRGWTGAAADEGVPRVRWIGLRGEELGREEWSNPQHATFGCELEPPAGEKADGLLALVNGGRSTVRFELPMLAERRATLLFYTPWKLTPRASVIGLQNWTVEPLSMVIFALGPPFAQEDGG